MNDDKKFDSRLIERHLEKGMFTEDELRLHLENLPDVAEKSTKFSIVQPISDAFHDDDLDADDDDDDLDASDDDDDDDDLDASDDDDDDE